MKKHFLALLMVISVTMNAYSQTDDRLVTSHLTISTQQQDMVDYLRGLDEGMAKVKNGEIRTFDEAYKYYGIEDSKIEPLTTVANKPNSKLSAVFLQKLTTVFDKMGSEYTTVSQVRAGFVDMATPALNNDEQKVLALMDMSLQKVVREFAITDVTTDNLAHRMDLQKSQKMPLSNLYKLPKWLKCIVGVFGGGIVGGIGGFLGGAAVGGILGCVVGCGAGIIAGGHAGGEIFCSLRFSFASYKV